ncbi:MAG: hypothetical protein JRJ59_00195 [Deltaproteobacteria bacterium]|nr:hypothetical protein [Deltaproteobacteria bacterium]
MPYGYNGRVLHVDLSEQTCRVEEPPETWYRTYLGGGAAAAYYLLRELPPGVDPLGPDNVLVFACSVVTGAPISGFIRYTVAAKSPLTNGFMESEAGGYFGPEMKFAGFDVLVIKGRAKKPVYLWLDHQTAEIREAGRFWGLETGPLKEALIQELGDKRLRVAAIGPASEKLIPFACLLNEQAHANGRGGLCAVMGSKNLKAVVCRGRPSEQIYADPAGVEEVARWQLDKIKEHPPSQNMQQNGTPSLVEGLNASGILPTRNFQDRVFEAAAKIGARAMKETILKRRGTCYRCGVGCKRVVEYQDGRFSVDPRYGGPEYETLASFGSLCGVDDLPAVAKAHEICNRQGLDTISAGCVIAFAMECFQKGVLTPAETGGRPRRSVAGRRGTPLKSRARRCPCTTPGARPASASATPSRPPGLITSSHPTRPPFRGRPSVSSSPWACSSRPTPWPWTSAKGLISGTCS